LVGIIFLRTTQKEFVLGEDDPDEDAGEELSWKLVQRDVFRPPSRLVFLSALVGCGYQILSAISIVLGLGVIGAHYHESRGSILSAFIMWYVLSSFVAGYFSGSIYAKNKGLQWIKTAFITSFLLPFSAVFLVGAVNTIAFYSQVMSYIPLGTLFLLSMIWAVLCVPISLVGTFFGRHLGKSALQNQQMPVNQVPRMIPTFLGTNRPGRSFCGVASCPSLHSLWSCSSFIAPCSITSSTTSMALLGLFCFSSSSSP